MTAQMLQLSLFLNYYCVNPPLSIDIVRYHMRIMKFNNESA